MKSLAKGVVIFFITLFIALLLFQLYFFLRPESADEARAKRLNAKLTTTEQNIATVDRQEEGLFVFLTFEAADSQGATCSLLINDLVVGDFSGGILSVKVYPGDEIFIIGGRPGAEISLMDCPANLKDFSLPPTLKVNGNKTFWGRVELK